MAEELKDQATGYLEELRDNQKTIEDDLDRLSNIKSGFSAIEANLRDLLNRLEGELKEDDLESIKDELGVIGEKIEEKKKIMDEDATELKKKLQYLQADFANYKKRMKREIEETRKRSNENLIVDLLDVIDNFERALSSINDEGLKLIYNQLKNILEREGVKPIEVGLKFDPFKHEAIETVKDESKEDWEVIEELQKGYMLHDKVIRHSRVKVVRNE